jgi:drug/metabolite transporter (DMT)-like permease
MAKQYLSKGQIILLMVFMFLTGSTNTIANKLQQNSKSLGIMYEQHQKFVTFCMFIGESICLLIYFLFINKNKEDSLNQIDKLLSDNEDSNLEKINYENTNETNNNETTTIEKNNEEILTEIKKEEAKFWYFLIPATFDLFGSSINSISLTYLPPSVYQMFRGAMIIFTVIGSKCFLGNKYYRHHYLGIFIVICGLITVGLNAIFQKKESEEKDKKDKPYIGIILVLTSQVFSCMLYISEEKLIKKYNAHPLKVTGTEGCWGIFLYIILLIIFYQIRCDSWGNIKDYLCVENDKHQYRIEDGIFAIRQIFHNIKLTFLVFLYISSIALFNFSGLTVTKYSNASARAIIDTLRTIMVWVFFLTMPFVPEKTKEHFSFIQLGGFLLLICGSLIFNEVIEITCCGFDKYTKRALAMKEERIEEISKISKEETKKD